MLSILVFSVLLDTAAGMCHHGTTLFPRAENTVPVAQFGFNELSGPLNWHGLNAANRPCAIGKLQSPINIMSHNITKVPGSTLELSIEKSRPGAPISNLGSTVEVAANGSFLRSGKVYKLKQFHFHTPSEHHLNSEYFPAEVHFVFQSQEGIVNPKPNTWLFYLTVS
jgi:carbonic anhydrase